MTFLLRRVGFFLLTLWAALTLNFFLPRMMPGSPLDTLRAKTHNRLSITALQDLLTSYGFKPGGNIFTQYVAYMQNMLTGRWGVNAGGNIGEPVMTTIAQHMWWTIGLVGLSTVIAFLIGTAVGIVAGWKRGGRLDSVLPPVFVVTSALPYFWVGLLLIFAFSTSLHLLPNDNTADITIVPGLSPGYIGTILQHAVLPSLTLVITAIGGWILTMRNNMITVLAEDYIRMGRAKGLSNRKIMYGYAARNAFLPNLSGFAMSIGFVLSGAILIEYTFNYKGLGYLLYSAVVDVNYPLMQALFLLYTLAVLSAILACDIATVWLDPRTRAKG